MLLRLVLIGAVLVAFSAPAAACRAGVKPPRHFKGCVFFDKSKDHKRVVKFPRAG
jgi:hypothetical protein